MPKCTSTEYEVHRGYAITQIIKQISFSGVNHKKTFLLGKLNKIFMLSHCNFIYLH